MFQIVDRFEIENSSKNQQTMEDKRLESEEKVDKRCESDCWEDTQDSVVSQNIFSIIFLLFIDSNPWISDASHNKSIDSLSFKCSRRVIEGGDVSMVFIEVMECEMRIIEFDHMKGG